MEDQTFEDTLESLKDENDDVKAQLKVLYDIVSKHQMKNKLRRIKEYDKAQLKENEPFTKHYHTRLKELQDIRRSELNAGDMGRFYMLTYCLEQDTGLIFDPYTGIPLNKTKMCEVCCEDRKHWNEYLQRLIDAGLIIVNENDGKPLYFVNKKFAFNGYSRLNVNYNINNINITNSVVGGDFSVNQTNDAKLST